MTGMLLMALTETGAGGVVIRLEGEVIGPWVDELKTVCERHLASYPGVTLDLADVRFIDRRGVLLFQTLKTRGVGLVRCSPFTAEQLKS